MVSWGPRHIYGRGVPTDLFRRRGIEGRTPSEVSGRVASGVALVAAKNPMTAGMSTHQSQSSNRLPDVGGPAVLTQLPAARGGRSATTTVRAHNHDARRGDPDSGGAGAATIFGCFGERESD